MRFSPSACVIRWMLIASVSIVALNLLSIVLHFPALAMLLAGGHAYRRMKRRFVSDAYGSACTGDLADLWRSGLLGDRGLIVGTCGYLDKPGKAEGIRALFSRRLPSPLACRLFLAAFFGRRWMEP